MSQNTTGLQYEAGENPPLWAALLLGVTHVLLIFDGVVFLPNVLSRTTSLPMEQVQYVVFVTLIVCGLTSLVQVLRVGRIGCGYILFMGSYSAFLTSVTHAVDLGGLALASTMILLTAPLVLLYSYFLRLVRHIVTPAVGGVVVILIAISLIPVALELWQGGGPTDGNGSLEHYLVGASTVAVMLGLMLFGNRILRLTSPLLGIGAGYMAAWFLGTLDLGLFRAAPWLGLPSFEWPGLTTDLSWDHAPLGAAFALSYLIVAMEGTGTIMLAQRASLRSFVRVAYNRVQGGLYATGLGNMAGGLMGAQPMGCYVDNVPFMEMTGVSSRLVGICGSLTLVVLAFLPKASGFILDMPAPVIGGILVVISVLLFYSGFSLLLASRLTTKTGLLLGCSLVAGMIAEAKEFFHGLIPTGLDPFLRSGVAMGGFTALALSCLIMLVPKKRIRLTLPAKPEAYADLAQALQQGSHKLGLCDRDCLRLNLACEEAFMYIANTGEESHGEHIRIRVVRQEEHVFVELESGNEVDEVLGEAQPVNFMHADEDDLGKLGLTLLRNTASDLNHMRISGVTYISFTI
mgnify:CR=1 FL=1